MFKLICILLASLFTTACVDSHFNLKNENKIREQKFNQEMQRRNAEAEQHSRRQLEQIKQHHRDLMNAFPVPKSKFIIDQK